LSSTDRSINIPYHHLVQQISQRSKLEIQRNKAQSEARNEYNNEQRERQRVLADNARNRDETDESGIVNADGLGRMENGWGYFPSLPTLLIQGNVPAPPASFADEEMKEKKRLAYILRFTTLVVALFWFLC